MAKVEEKVTELTALIGNLKTSVDGIKGDLTNQSAKLTEQAAEIESLKQAVLDAQGGELSAEDLARFDALIASTKDLAQQASDLDAQLPNVEAPEPAGGGDQPQG